MKVNTCHTPGCNNTFHYSKKHGARQAKFCQACKDAKKKATKERNHKQQQEELKLNYQKKQAGTWRRKEVKPIMSEEDQQAINRQCLEQERSNFRLSLNTEYRPGQYSMVGMLLAAHYAH